LKRNANIDALRAVAVLMVLGRHMEAFPLWTKVGWAGVDLFFVLSGFLIAGLLFAEWKEHGSVDVGRFYIRRGFKIYPAFYFFLAVTIPAAMFWPRLTQHRVTAASAAAEVLFVQNYFVGVWGHTWSLAVEEHFYLVLPLLLWILHRRDRSADPFRLLPVTFMIVAPVVLVMRICAGSVHDYRTYLVPTHLRIDSLLFGVLLAYYRHLQPGTFARIAGSRGALCVTLFSIVLLFVFPLENPIMHTAGFTALYLGFGFFLARVVDLTPGRIAASVVNPLARMGFRSYSIYLWHFGVARMMPQLPGCPRLTFALYVAVSITLGIAMAKLIELPALQIRERFFPSPRILRLA
jgi:peptidoglycan/LPS O-acetylase OafA/YrhL